jgi:hypothetical protein
MANLAAPEQNRLLAQLASLLRGREEVQAQMNPTMMGTLMDLILPSAQTVEKLSYGDPMFRMPPSGTGGYIPITTDKQYAAELIGMSPAIPAASRATARISNEAADQLVRAITRNPEATAPAALEAAEQMAPLSRIFRPEQVKSVLPKTKVVDEAGNPQIVYHGTPDAFESNIRAESYFTSQPELANMYTNTSASSIATRPKLGETPAIYPSYLNIKKPFDTRDPKIRKEFMEEYYGKYSRTPLSNRSGLPDWTEGRDLKEWIEESGKKYDGLILDEGGIPMPDGTVMSRGISYVPFKEEQIKSAISDPSFAGLLDEPAQSVEKIYHGTSPQAAKQIEKAGFDITKSADGSVWFTNNPDIGEVSASGKGAVVERLADINKLKLGGWEETDKFSTNELIQKGFDGLRLVNGDTVTYQIFNPEKLQKAIK